MTFLWFELAKNPEKQQKLYEEITLACGDDGVTKEALAKMSYLKACVREIMRWESSDGSKEYKKICNKCYVYVQIDDLLNFRLYRPTVMQFRRLENEAVIGGYRIPPQVIIITIQYDQIYSRK